MIRAIGASVCGASHERMGLTCQDAHACRRLANDLLLFVVADGAGSACMAEAGSSLAVERVLQGLTRPPQSFPRWECEEEWRALLVGVFLQAREALQAEANARGVPLRELATTLIAGVASATGAAIAQIGDGAVAIRDEKGDVFALTMPQSGEYINETRFLTSLENPAEIEISLYHGSVTHIAAFSDGLQGVALRQLDSAPHPPFFTPLFQFAAKADSQSEAEAQLAQFLTSERLRQRADDDLTLVLGCFT